MSKNANGNGSIRKKEVTKNGKKYIYWEGRVTVGVDPGTGKAIQRSFTGKTQKAVAEKMREAVAAVDDGTLHFDAKMTLAAWVETWLSDYASVEVKPSSLHTYEAQMRRHVLPHLGGTRLCDLTPPLLQKWVNSLVSNGLGGRTADAILTILHNALEKAYQLDMIASNPCNKVSHPRYVKKTFTPCNDEDLKNLFTELETHNDDYAPMIRFAILTGMRESEICGLPWSAVDLNAGEVGVRQQLCRRDVKGGTCYISTPKNGKERTLTLPPMAVDLLRQRLKEQRKNSIMLGSLYDNPLGLVFTRQNGEHIPPTSLSHHFKTVGNRIGRPDLRFHDLRHTFATLCLQNGDSVKQIQTALGHSTSAITIDLYCHRSDAMARESADKLQKYLENIG